MVAAFYLLDTYTPDVFSTDVRNATFCFLDSISKVSFQNTTKYIVCILIVISNSVFLDWYSYSSIHSIFENSLQFERASTGNIWYLDDFCINFSMFYSRDQGHNLSSESFRIEDFREPFIVYKTKGKIQTSKNTSRMRCMIAKKYKSWFC